jgi:hypothetical protein
MMYGQFSGAPKTEWLFNSTGPDRDMKLLEDFWYIDPSGKRWNAPNGSVINGASIPRPLWSTIGSPYTDDYRCASIVHDVACDDPTVPRSEADRMFYFACLAGGCSTFQAKLLYAGVRIGAWSEDAFPPHVFTKEHLLLNITARPLYEEKKVQLKFEEITRDLIEMREDASFEEIEALVSKHLD